MAPRWMSMLVAALAVAAHGRVNADADCLQDYASCLGTEEACPVVCCSGAPPRMTGGIRFCRSDSVVADALSANSNSPDTGGSVPEPASNSFEDEPNSDLSPSASSSASSNAQEPSYSSASQGEYTEAPASSPEEQATGVDAFDNSSPISGSRGGGGGATTIVAVVGAVAACIILVAAVFLKRKNPTKQPLEIPGSSYHGANGSGLTPDNRSLDGMLGRESSDSMKQLPVLSMASRQDASIVRLSSPFANGSVRISSPAHRGGSNEDFAFAVDTSSRAGSHVNVNFVDTDMEIVVQKNGVVAL